MTRAPSGPLVNRGPEALQEVLREDGGAADRNLRSLTRSELLELATSADRLASMARALVRDVWPTFQAASDA